MASSTSRAISSPTGPWCRRRGSARCRRQPSPSAGFHDVLDLLGMDSVINNGKTTTTISYSNSMNEKSI